MDGGIFICYRRQDSAGHAGRLYDRLAARFGDERVFMDVEGIKPGEVFGDVISRQVAHCQVLLAMIGPEWLAADVQGIRRLDRPDDFVRREIEAALEAKVWVIPVLMEDTPMPAVDSLPPSLAPLAGRHASSLSSTRFHFDCSELIEAIERVLEASGPPEGGGTLPGGPVVSHAEVDFGTLLVGAPSPELTIEVGSAGGPIDAEVLADKPWITVRKEGDQLRLRIDTAVVGRLDGELRVTGPGGETSVPVHALVVRGPTLAVEPQLVDFGRQPAGVPAERAVRVANHGYGDLQWSHQCRGQFFSAERTPGGLRVWLRMVDPGPCRGAILVSSNGGEAEVEVRADVLPAEPIGPAPAEKPPRNQWLAEPPTGPPTGPPAGLPTGSRTGPATGLPTGPRTGPASGPLTGLPTGPWTEPATGPLTGPPGHGEPTRHLRPGEPPTGSGASLPGGASYPEPDGPSRRRRLTLAAVGLVTVLAAGLGLLLVPRSGDSDPERLEDVVATFPADFVGREGHTGQRDVQGVAGYFASDSARVREVLTGLGFRRGYVSILDSADSGETLAVMVIELESPAAPQQAAPGVSACRNGDWTDVDVPAVEGETGRQCRNGGRQVQEVSFTRDRRLYRLKLDNPADPTSTSRIVELAQRQVAVAR